MPVINTKGYKRLTIDELNMNGCINLLEAFVSDVSQSFIIACRKCIENPQDEKYRENYNNYKDLILSEYFGQLTGLDGRVIVDSLEERCIQGRYTLG